jgi:hypothetical protein
MCWDLLELVVLAVQQGMLWTLMLSMVDWTVTVYAL